MRAPILVGLLVLPSIASAHIHLTFPTPRTDAPTGDQKVEHCGTVNWVRADHADRNNTFLPGQTITVTWMETINHPGYYRIAFQPAGETFRIPPAGNGPPAGFPDENLTGMTDAPTGSLILVDRVADGMLSQSITFPNMECANCTLQLIQVMTDKAPYTVDANSDDLYFKCADITLSASAPDAGPNQPTPDAGVDPGNPMNPTTELDGGCSAGAGAGLAVAAMLAGLRRRRRR